MATALPRIEGAQRARLKGWIVALAVVVLLVGGFLAVQGGRLVEGGGANIVGYELAGTGEEAARILDEWGADGRDAATVQLVVDYVYALAYAALLLSWCVYLGELAADRGWARVRRLGWVLGALAAVAGGLDLAENSFLLFQLHRGPSDLTAAAARWLANVKFLFVGAAVLYVVVVGLVLVATRRRRGIHDTRAGRPVEIRSSGEA